MDSIVHEVGQLPSPHLAVFALRLKQQRDQAAAVPFYGDLDPLPQAPFDRAISNEHLQEVLQALIRFNSIALALDVEA